MAQHVTAAVTSSAFDLKNEAVTLFPQVNRSDRTTIAIDDLEAMRTEGSAIPASKHGLEVICGASCETGAI